MSDITPDKIGTVRRIEDPSTELRAHIYLRLVEPVDEPWHIVFSDGPQQLSGWQSDEDMQAWKSTEVGYVPVVECGSVPAVGITEEMIERAAHAMLAQQVGNVSRKPVEWQWENVLADTDREIWRHNVRAVLEAALAGRTVADPAREEYIGCHHPAWPDPLTFLSRRSAEEWFAENHERFPVITVRRRVVSDWETVLDAASGSSESGEPT